MTIYEFSTIGARKGNLYSVTTLQMVEKTRIYMGGGRRINKDEIGILNTTYGCRMYLLEDNPEPFISAMIARYENEVKRYDIYLSHAKAMLNRWKGADNGRKAD